MTSSFGSPTPAPEITRGDPSGAAADSPEPAAQRRPNRLLTQPVRPWGFRSTPGTENGTPAWRCSHGAPTSTSGRDVTVPLIRCLNTLDDEIMGVPGEGCNPVVAESANEMIEALNRRTETSR